MRTTIKRIRHQDGSVRTGEQKGSGFTGISAVTGAVQAKK